MKKRNCAIDFLKFLFCIVICLFHGSLYISEIDGNRIVVAGSLAVEFFFVVSGYYMCVYANKVENRNRGDATFTFIKRKITKLYPNIFVSYVIAFVAFHLSVEKGGIRIWVTDFVKSLSEILLISHSGMNWKTYIGGTWYLSVMLMSMCILFPLLLKYQDSFFYVICPMTFLLILGYMFNQYGIIVSPHTWMGVAYKGLFRGIVDILGGCICYKFSIYLQKHKFTLLMKTLFTLIEWCGYLVCILFMCISEPSGYDFIVLFTIMLSVTITVANISFDQAIFNRKLYMWLGEYSFSVYISHIYWAQLNATLFPQNLNIYLRYLIFLLSSFLTGLFVMYASRGLRRLYKRYLPDIKKLIIIE